MVTEIQALATRGFGGGSMRRAVSGLDAGRVAMLLAVLTRHARLPMADQEIYAATVGGIAATEPAADLAIALALASALRGTALPPTVCAIGEVSLSGDVRSVPGLDRRLAEAARLGMTTALVPAGHHNRLTTDMVTRPVATIEAALSAAGALAGLVTAPDPLRPPAGPRIRRRTQVRRAAGAPRPSAGDVLGTSATHGDQDVGPRLIRVATSRR